MNEVAANWKIVLAGFLEGYHIRALDEHTFFPYGFDNLNIVELFGNHSRVIFPFQRIQKLAKLAPAEQRVTGYATLVYQIFPNAIVTVLSNHISLFALEPLSIDRTRMTTYTLFDPDKVTAEDLQRDIDFVRTTGGEEDMAAACAIQRGMADHDSRHFLAQSSRGARPPLIEKPGTHTFGDLQWNFFSSLWPARSPPAWHSMRRGFRPTTCGST